MNKEKKENGQQKNNIFSEIEEEVLNFWDKSKIFEKSVERKAPKGDYVFYDGPPFATGTPHYGHIAGSLIKDAIPRYWTMRGFRVERKWGWDCHGLPIENIVEKEMGSKSKKDIEKIGVDKFNEQCRSKVLKYVDEWKKTIRRLGRWADMENCYKTMDLDFMESVWWVFKQLYDKGLIYEGYRSMHICPRCETTLSQSEVAEGYRDIKDLSATVKFKLKYKTGTTGRGIGALIFNDKNEILLLRRNENRRRKTWALVGGKVDAGETFDKALKREVMEELGVKIKSAKPFSAKSDILEGRIFETVCYKVKIEGEPVIMEKDKADKLKWFSLDNLPEIDYSPSENAIDIYKNEKEKFYFDINIDRPLSNVYILAWTTTPWTLLGNVALAIGENIKYAMVKIENDFYILAKDRIEEVLKDKEYKFVADVNGEDLVGLKYEPIFDYYSKDENLKNRENGWKIYAGDFVNTDEGTGVVHIAPAFGDDDMKLGKKENLPFIQHIGMDGVIKKEAKDFTGLNVKPLGDHQKTDIEIIKYLAHENLLFAKEKYEHSYPHCWRCDSPLLNYATSSWFVNILKIKERMLELAEDINWSPEHIKKGRWGKWLEGARDWSISRQRFWASVIPIWHCEKCNEIKVIGSIDELAEAQGNGKFIAVRHGQAEHNLKNLTNGKIENDIYNLTNQGKKDAVKLAKNLKKEKVDLIICSDFLRTKQTAEILNKNWNAKIILEPRLRDIKAGIFEEQNVEKSLKFRRQSNNFYSAKHPEGESMADVEKRTKEFLNEIKRRFPNKTILIVSHEDAIRTIYKYFDQGKKPETFFTSQKIKIATASHHIFYFQPITDLHKHTVDKIIFKCEKCGGGMKRVSDVLDCWFESGSMPFAQFHYPFERKKEWKNIFPADFIIEYTGQLRGWFYYLHVLANALFDSLAFKNVIVSGVLAGTDGRKMSKSYGNYPDSKNTLDKYGADALRLYFMSSSIMAGDDTTLSEKDIQDALRKNVMLLWNVSKFYGMFCDNKKDIKEDLKLENILDKWIVTRLNQVIEEITDNMEKYNLQGAARPITGFIDDLSTWYLRRSRDRFKGDDKNDKIQALKTTKYVLLTFSKVIAPVMPFISEQVWQKVSGNDFEDENKSVHLEGWPKTGKIDKNIIAEMEVTRKIVELALAKRDEAGVKVRQPLSKLRITNCELRDEYMDLIKDELNVKIVETQDFASSAKEDNIKVELDTKLTPELKQEGIKREMVRTVNNMRKNIGLTIYDRVVLFWQSENQDIIQAIKKYSNNICDDVLADEIKNEKNDEVDINKDLEINGAEIWLGIK
ncbi:class I tRNA ligase family protein [Candidatus Parcubacteria bacterium]|nr:class I tRNA ligase family protein [Candidatus Parcubacteria bacterium]